MSISKYIGIEKQEIRLYHYPPRKWLPEGRTQWGFQNPKEMPRKNIRTHTRRMSYFGHLSSVILVSYNISRYWSENINTTMDKVQFLFFFSSLYFLTMYPLKIPFISFVGPITPIKGNIGRKHNPSRSEVPPTNNSHANRTRTRTSTTTSTTTLLGFSCHGINMLYFCPKMANNGLTSIVLRYWHSRATV